MIIGCVYRPPWADIGSFNVLLNNMLDSLHKKHLVLLLDDFNMELSHDVNTTIAMEKFKNIFCSHHLYPLINKPTREVKSSKTIIDHIYCNIHHILNASNAGIIRTYISDHQAMLCLFNMVKLQDYKHNTTMRHSFCDRNIPIFTRYLKKETWDIAYEEKTQVVLTWFQSIIDLFFDKCFQKRSFKMTYQTRYPWLTDDLRTRITTKKLCQEVFLNPENINLKNEYKLKRNRRISDLRNMDIE